MYSEAPAEWAKRESYTSADTQSVYFAALVDWATLNLMCIFYSVCDMKAALLNEQLSLIWEIMLNEFELSHNATEGTKNNF